MNPITFDDYLVALSPELIQMEQASRNDIKLRDKFLAESGIVPYPVDKPSEGLTHNEETIILIQNAAQHIRRTYKMSQIDPIYARLKSGEDCARRVGAMELLVQHEEAMGRKLAKLKVAGHRYLG